MTKRLFSTLIAALLLLVSAWVAFHRPHLNYPMMAMDAAERLSVSFLLDGKKSSVDCQATTASLASSMLAKCPGCRIKQLQCLSELSAEQERQLSSAPLSIPSARMINGVVLYISPDSALALASCQESERQSAQRANGTFLLKCFPPETPRVLATDRAVLDVGQFATWQAGAVLLLLCTAAFLLLTAWRSGSDEPLSGPSGKSYGEMR